MGDVLAHRQFADSFDSGEAGLAQDALAVAELPERLADLPVGRMNEAHRCLQWRSQLRTMPANERPMKAQGAILPALSYMKEQIVEPFRQS
ncbi:MAG: hypothetical protein ACOYJQ_13320 [Pseudochelatococcus sp.]|uniref:hypothetical protein n=1 Tax=Pseudochelatococcus sp. TaxID=2020869 RepID=UPI003D8C03C6